MMSKTLPVAVAVALTAGLVAVPAVHVPAASAQVAAHSIPTELVAELRALRDNSVAAYDGNLVVRYEDGLFGTDFWEIGSSRDNGGSMWARSQDDSLTLAVGAAFDGQTFMSPVLTAVAEDRPRMAAAAERAGIAPSTLVRVPDDQYAFWDLETFTLDDVEEAQTWLSPISFLDYVLRHTDNPKVTVSKDTSGTDTRYVCNTPDLPGTLTLVARGGVLVEALSEGDSMPSVTRTVAYGAAVTAPPVPSVFVEAADVAPYFTEALSYRTRQEAREWVRYTAKAATSRIADVKKPTVQKVRGIIKRELRRVILDGLEWKTADTRRGVRATAATPWGPIVHTFTYDERTRRVTVSR